jgi:hypothetical protein
MVNLVRISKIYCSATHSMYAKGISSYGLP